MDLASYLLKPIQRMSKYALLLKDLIKECSQSQEQELSDLHTAEDMVKFQLRHGNDLLAMDAIRGCDVSSNRDRRKNNGGQWSFELFLMLSSWLCWRRCEIRIPPKLLLFSVTQRGCLCLLCR